MRFIATATGRDGGTSYRRGKDRADAELAVDTGETPWVRIFFDGEELACAPFLQIAEEIGNPEDKE